MTIIDTGRYRLNCSLELGGWTEDRVSKILFNMQADEKPAVDRLAYWSEKFVGTPFRYESALPPVGRNTLRVRLASFDCITYVYHVIALAKATSFPSYVQRLYEIRYNSNSHGLIDNHPRHGNFFDFAYEALVLNCIGSGFLEDITEVIAERGDIVSVNMRLQPFARPLERDARQEFVRPRFPEKEVEASVIPFLAIEKIPVESFRSGDIILFTHGSKDRNGVQKQFFVCHAGIVWLEGGEVLLLHATKNYYITRSGNQGLRAADYLFGDRRFAQPGVALAGEYLGDQAILTSCGVQYYGYSADRPRLMADYAHNFLGIKVLRPC